MDIYWTFKKFEALTAPELYTIVALREKVFVVEQQCVYLDADGLDREAYHLEGILNGELVAYCRVYYSQEAVHIGRVVVAFDYRGKGLAYRLMEQAHAKISYVFPESSIIRISAQKYLQPFYEKTGYKTTGKAYQEDGIPHIAMYKLLVHP